MILPLLHGVEIAENIRKILPEPRSAIYIIARQVEHGVIKQTGTLNQWHFCSQEIDDQGLNKLQALFNRTGLQADIAADIETEP